MSLQRKENNLRRAQARLDRIQNPPRWKVVSHLKAREFQIDYRREPNRHGRYRTRAYIVRGAKAYHGNNRGLIHKAVNLKYRVQGDKPSVTRTIKSWQPKTMKPQRLQKKEKQRDRLNDKKSKSNNRLNRQESKLKEKHDSYKKRKKPKPKKKKGAKDTISAALKAAWKFVKNVYESEVKKFFLCLAIPVIVILLVFAIFTMIFSATSSHSGFTLGTYAAQDYDLSEAEKYYTELAYNLNQKIRKVGSSTDWQSGLAAFGANTGDLEDTPDEWVWGQSTVYDWTPQYDFDTYKLWSFLCAYYYDFDADNDDIYYWEFDGDTEDLLEEIFNDEYEFVYWYDNQSRWEELDNYVYFGGGSSTDGSYYYCEQDASNHQTLHNLLPGATIRDYDLKREFGYEMTGWNTDSDGLYQGIKVYCTNGDKLKAPFKGKITDVDTTDNKITIRKDDVEYWYDGTGGTKRDTEVTIANAKLLSGFSEGDTVNDGQEFAKTTAGNVNFHIYIDTDGYGWDYIDPRLVLY